MKIDWFTVAAQALNFILLVWMMRRFLYKPILNVIDEREKRIAAELENAEKKQADAKIEQYKFQQKNEEFDLHRTDLFGKAKDEAQTLHRKLLDEARTTAEMLRSKQRESLRNETNSLHQEIVRRTQQEVFAIARKTLMDLADVNLEELVSAVLVTRLAEMGDQAKAEVAAMKDATDSVLVRSAFDLPPKQRAAIQNSLNETFSAEINLQFETAPSLIAGIELNVNGYKVAWSIAEYLASMENSIDAILEENENGVQHAENVLSKPETEDMQ